MKRTKRKTPWHCAANGKGPQASQRGAAPIITLVIPAVLLLLALVLKPLSIHAGQQPPPPPVVTNMAVAAGANHSLFLQSDGSLWGMGANSYGELGLGKGVSYLLGPTRILLNGVTAIASGVAAQHSLFRSGRQLWARGYNQYGQLGDGTTTNHYVPERIFAGSISVSASVMAGGGYHSLFATYSSTSPGSTGLNVVGANGLGELGDGTDIARHSPEQVESGTAISEVAAGYDYSLYLRSDGSLWGMGNNSAGQLGLGPISATNIQTQIVPSGVIAVAAGYGHSLFIKSDGSLWGMGADGQGELGDGGVNGNVKTPEQIVSSSVKAVAAGEGYSLFIKSDGSLWGMGRNLEGELGLGINSHPDFLSPTQIASGVVAVAAGYHQTLFIKSNGSLWGMGDNSAGQLGLGDIYQVAVPTQIVGPVSARILVPSITSISFSGTDLVINGANGAPDENIYTLVGTNATQALSTWDCVATNTLSAYGNFTIIATNAVDPTALQRYYTLLAQ